MNQDRRINHCRDSARTRRSMDASSVRPNGANMGMEPHGRGVHATTVIDPPILSRSDSIGRPPHLPVIGVSIPRSVGVAFNAMWPVGQVRETLAMATGRPVCAALDRTGLAGIRDCGIADSFAKDSATEWIWSPSSNPNTVQ